MQVLPAMNRGANGLICYDRMSVGAYVPRNDLIVEELVLKLSRFFHVGLKRQCCVATNLKAP